MYVKYESIPHLQGGRSEFATDMMLNHLKPKLTLEISCLWERNTLYLGATSKKSEPEQGFFYNDKKFFQHLLQIRYKIFVNLLYENQMLNPIVLKRFSLRSDSLKRWVYCNSKVVRLFRSKT